MAEHYQPEAVKAAEEEMISRALTNEELQLAENELAQKKAAKENILNENFIDKVSELGNTYYPLQQSTATTHKGIIAFCVFWGLNCLFSFGKLAVMLTKPHINAFKLMFDIIPVVVIATATTLFYLRKKAGWYIFFIGFSMAIFFVVFTVASILLKDISQHVPNFDIGGQVLILVIIAALIYFLLRRDVRDAFTVGYKDAAIATVISAIITSLLIAFSTQLPQNIFRNILRLHT